MARLFLSTRFAMAEPPATNSSGSRLLASNNQKRKNERCAYDAACRSLQAQGLPVRVLAAHRIGMSSGPKTDAGRMSIAAAQKPALGPLSVSTR
jgi:hypothetical protein